MIYIYISYGTRLSFDIHHCCDYNLALTPNATNGTDDRPAINRIDLLDAGVLKLVDGHFHQQEGDLNLRLERPDPILFTGCRTLMAYVPETRDEHRKKRAWGGGRLIADETGGIDSCRFVQFTGCRTLVTCRQYVRIKEEHRRGEDCGPARRGRG